MGTELVLDWLTRIRLEDLKVENFLILFSFFVILPSRKTELMIFLSVFF